MTTAEVGNQLVALCRDRKFVDAVESLYGDEVVSVEAVDFQGMGREMRGKGAVVAKNRSWFAENEVQSFSVTGPFVSPEQFAVLHSFEWTVRASGERVRLSEVAVYTVVDGKIIREEFLYADG